MPKDVEKIKVLFSCRRKLTVDEARKIEVYAVQELLRRINAHEKIRPYLREYPFDVNRVGVPISVIKNGGGHPLDGSVGFVTTARNKIFYYIAEIYMKEPTPLIYMNEKNEVVKEFIGGGPRERLIPLMEEDYEEAVKIVEATPADDIYKEEDNGWKKVFSWFSKKNRD